MVKDPVRTRPSGFWMWEVKLGWQTPRDRFQTILGGAAILAYVAYSLHRAWGIPGGREFLRFMLRNPFFHLTWIYFLLSSLNLDYMRFRVLQADTDGSLGGQSARSKEIAFLYETVHGEDRHFQFWRFRGFAVVLLAIAGFQLVFR